MPYTADRDGHARVLRERRRHPRHRSGPRQIASLELAASATTLPLTMWSTSTTRIGTETACPSCSRRAVGRASGWLGLVGQPAEWSPVADRRSRSPCRRHHSVTISVSEGHSGPDHGRRFTDERAGFQLAADETLTERQGRIRRQERERQLEPVPQFVDEQSALSHRRSSHHVPTVLTLFATTRVLDESDLRQAFR